MMKDSQFEIKNLVNNINRVVLPLDYNYATTGDLLVKVGDRVTKNQALTKFLPDNKYSICVHSPIDGVVKSIGYHPVLKAHDEQSLQDDRVKCVEIIAAEYLNDVNPDELNTLQSGCRGQAAAHREEKAAGREKKAVPGEENIAPWINKNKNNEYNNIGKRDLLKILSQNGIIGLGGAGFPSAKKLEQTKVNYLVINGVECESPILVDNTLIIQKYDEVQSGINILIKLLEPAETILAIKETMTEAHKVIKENTSHSKIKISLVPNEYPNGYSKTLINLVTDTKIDKTRHSSASGIICLNVATVHAIYKALQGEPLTNRLVTITGNINNTGTYDLPVGTPISALLDNFKIDVDLVKQGYKYLVVKLGGDYMGYDIFNSQTNTADSFYDFLNFASIDKTTQTIKIEYNDINIKSYKNKAYDFFTKIKNSVKDNKSITECIKCGLCEPVCPANLLPQQLYWLGKNLDHDNNQELVKNYNISSCIECGLCDKVCPSNIPLATNFKHLKSKLKIKNYKDHYSNISKERHELTKLKQEKKQVRKSKVAISSGRSAKKSLLAAALERANKKRTTNNEANTSA